MKKDSVGVLCALVAVIVFVLGVFGLHVGAVSGVRWQDAGLAFLAAAILLG